MSTTYLCGTSGAPVKLKPVDYHVTRTLCCMSASMDGATACGCWEPIYDAEQSDQLHVAAEPATRNDMCGDCAYRKGSPERESGALDGLTSFWCHDGLRRATHYRHPDGRVREALEGDYRPPIVGATPYRADGRPAMRCAGYAATARKQSVYTPAPSQL